MSHYHLGTELYIDITFMNRHLLGIDLGSSFVKACLLEARSGKVAAEVTMPAREMTIHSPQPGWAEQDPRLWWQCVTDATRKVVQQSGVAPGSVSAIGISYQMHGLVIVDRDLQPLRPAIIWCDSRAVATGDAAAQRLGSYASDHLLNSPGNFTASKLKWVSDHEPDVFRKIHKAMLPGDYIAMKMTGVVATTASGLSEGIFWDFKNQGIAAELLSTLEIPRTMLPDMVPAFSPQGVLSSAAATELGLLAGTPVSYRAGDQPNNAFSLNALHPGDVAATAGTSGVIYAVTDKLKSDPKSRVNTFLHVNHQPDHQRLGVLLCVNGTGILYSWLRKVIQDQGLTYEAMNSLAAQVPPGAEGLCVLPFGNGAERMLGNRDLGASFHGINLVRHHQAHLCRAVQEGIAFALGYGFEVLNELDIRPQVIRAGRANLFRSDVFCQTFAQVTGTRLELFHTDGAQGAARAAGWGAGLYETESAAFASLEQAGTFVPEASWSDSLHLAFDRWKTTLSKQLAVNH